MVGGVYDWDLRSDSGSFCCFGVEFFGWLGGRCRGRWGVTVFPVCLVCGAEGQKKDADLNDEGCNSDGVCVAGWHDGGWRKERRTGISLVSISIYVQNATVGNFFFTSSQLPATFLQEDDHP